MSLNTYGGGLGTGGDAYGAEISFRVFQNPILATKIRLTIQRLESNKNGLSKFDDLSQADFFPEVSIGGKDFTKTIIWNRDTIAPNWQFDYTASSETIPIILKIQEEDVFRRQDADINSMSGKRELNLFYNVRTNEISGDLNGKGGETLLSRGDGTRRASISFKIENLDNFPLSKKVYNGVPNIGIIFVGNENNEIYAGEGEHTITSGFGNDLIYGGSLADIIYAGAGNNRIFAGEGKNIVVTEQGNDIVYTGSGRDFVSTGEGDDTIYAGEGDNWINAGIGNNSIFSGSGRDLFILNAGAGFDTINNFEIGKDKLGLTGGLKQDQLAITPVNSGNTFFTQISIAGSSDVLAKLNWTQASQLTGNFFSPNLPSSTSSLLSIFG